MSYRLAIFAALGLGGGLLETGATERPGSTITALWPGGIQSSAVCVDRKEWFISVVPPAVPLEGIHVKMKENESGPIEGKILFLDVAQRLCLIEVSTEFTDVLPFSLTDIASPKAGDPLECLSDQSTCLTALAGKDWSYHGEQFPMPLLRVRVSDPDKFGDSGTPLICSEGHLVGLLTGPALGASGEVHAIPVCRIRKMVEEVKRFKKSGPVWIGLIFLEQSSTPEVIEVKPDSPAEAANVKSGDIILTLDGNAINSLPDLVEIIHSLSAGEKITVTVLRGTSEETLSITPKFADRIAAAP